MTITVTVGVDRDSGIPATPDGARQVLVDAVQTLNETSGDELAHSLRQPSSERGTTIHDLMDAVR